MGKDVDKYVEIEELYLSPETENSFLAKCREVFDYMHAKYYSDFEMVVGKDSNYEPGPNTLYSWLNRCRMAALIEMDFKGDDLAIRTFATPFIDQILELLTIQKDKNQTKDPDTMSMAKAKSKVFFAHSSNLMALLIALGEIDKDCLLRDPLDPTEGGQCVRDIAIFPDYASVLMVEYYSTFESRYDP